MDRTLKVILVDSDLFLHGLGMSSLLIEMREAFELRHVIKDKVNLAG
jgi:hypothetical protein